MKVYPDKEESFRVYANKVYPGLSFHREEDVYNGGRHMLHPFKRIIDHKWNGNGYNYENTPR